MNANSLLARLEELKKWQQRQQERLSQQQTFRGDVPTETRPLGYGPDGDSDTHNLKSGNPVIVRVENPRRPKRPFLKRGAGLLRYKMADEDRTKPYGTSIAVRRKRRGDDGNVPVAVGNGNRNLELNLEGVLSPLKTPNVDIKLDDEGKNSRIDEESLVKQTICSINEIASMKINSKADVHTLNYRQFFGDERHEKNSKTIESRKETIESREETIESRKETIESRKETIESRKETIESRKETTDGPKETKDDSEEKKDETPQNRVSDETLYEKNSERELLIFEALEERMMNSSFSSTNSSILKILSSTPNKLKSLKLGRNEIKEIDDDDTEKNIEKTDYKSSDSSASANDRDEEKTIESCSEETESSGTEESSSALSESDAEESTLENCEEIKELVSKSANTEFSRNDAECSENETVSTERDESSKTDEEILTRKLRELDGEIRNFRLENAKLQRKKIDLERRESSLRKEKKDFEKYVLEEKVKVEFYLEDEKKKFAKEKLVFERYAKDVHSKTSRKEREEITALKDEVANVKEAAKVKETRNATSQARLRNQIKTYEKEVGNLKEELERLRKENAKLNTSQKYNKKSESKVLQEINRNLSKLTKDVKTVEKEPIKTVERREEEIKTDDVSGRFDNYSNFGRKVVIESPKSLERKARELVDENLVKTYREVFGNDSTLNAEGSAILNDSKMSKTEIVSPDGTKETKYSNGNVKTVSADGNLVTMNYFNGDRKETKLGDGTVKYYYSENRSWHMTYPDRTEVIEFADGQTETKRKDGTHEVKLPNGTVKVTRADRSENVTYPDGTTVNVGANGDKEIVLPNGQKEVHTKEQMRREYLDGTVKILYPDGIQETRYSNGRIRIKDRHGTLLLDSHDETT